MHIPFILSGLYLFFIFGIQSVMTDKEPFNLRYPLALWSLLIGLFSLIGSLRVVPALVSLIREVGWMNSICSDTRQIWVVSHPAGFWAFHFALSKVPELLDTFFIVLRKRKLITLHWYHHITVMTFSWHVSCTASLYGIYFSAMNFTVHAFMYIFYFLAALGYRPTAYAQSVTLLQISQMFAGTIISFYTVYHMTFIEPQDIFTNILQNSMAWNFDAELDQDDAKKCVVNPANALAGLAMYSSYLWLFCLFFYHAYLAPKKPAMKAITMEEGKKVN